LEIINTHEISLLTSYIITIKLRCVTQLYVLIIIQHATIKTSLYIAGVKV